MRARRLSRLSRRSRLKSIVRGLSVALSDVAIDRDGKFIQSFGKYGKVWYRIPDPLELVGTSAAEGIAVDARGNVYGG